MKSMFIVLCAVLLTTSVADNIVTNSADLVLLSDAVNSGAVCLDGSAPGYYFRAGRGCGSNKWILYFQGGGWCYDEKECVERSNGDLGSSKNWPSTRTFRPSFLSDDPSYNPDFFEWNLAFIQYCDGASFAGNVDTPHTVDGTTIYFRGFKILEEILNALLVSGMKDATEVILAGCSAGGLAVYLHVDYVQSVLKPSVKFRALSDGGYFMDSQNIEGQYHIRELYQQVFEMQNCRAGVNQDCIKHYQRTGEEWRCFFARYTYPFIRSQIFTLNSKVDTWQLDNVLQIGCRPPNCNDEQMKLFDKLNGAFWVVGLEMYVKPDAGAFLHSCLTHCDAQRPSWNGIKINGWSIREAFAIWYYNDNKTVWSYELDSHNSHYASWNNIKINGQSIKETLAHWYSNGKVGWSYGFDLRSKKSQCS